MLGIEQTNELEKGKKINNEILIEQKNLKGESNKLKIDLESLKNNLNIKEKESII